MSLTDSLYDDIENNVCPIIALDLQKAFNSVDRDILFQKLSWYGITDKCIISLLSNRGQYVEIKNKKSSVQFTKTGISQGAPSSTLWFNIYIMTYLTMLKNQTKIFLLTTVPYTTLNLLQI